MDCRIIPISSGTGYAHGADYVRNMIAAAGLTLAHLAEAWARTGENEPVRGLVVVAAKT